MRTAALSFVFYCKYTITRVTIIDKNDKICKYSDKLGLLKGIAR